jgi:hypothetical protein
MGGGEVEGESTPDLHSTTQSALALQWTGGTLRPPQQEQVGSHGMLKRQ